MGETSNFASYNNSGATMTFANGYTISIRWGPGNSCSNKQMPEDQRKMLKPNDDEFYLWYYAPRQLEKLEAGWHSRTAEVAVWTGEGENKDWKDVSALLSVPEITIHYGSKTEGWLTTDDVAKLITTVSTIKIKGDKIWDKLKIW